MLAGARRRAGRSELDTSRLGRVCRDVLGRTTASPSRSSSRIRDEHRRDLDAAARGGERGHRRDSRRSPRAAARTPRSSSSSSCSTSPRGQPDHSRRSPTELAAPTGRATTTSSRVDELRDAWPLLDLEERSDGLRVLPREDAEEFFISLSAARPGRAAAPLPPRPAPPVDAPARARRRRRRRSRKPARSTAQTLLALLDAPTRKEVHRAARVRRGRGRRPDVDALRAAAPEDDRRRGDQLPAPAGAREARDDLRRVRRRRRAAPARRRVVPRSVRRRSEEDRRRDHGDRRRPRHRRDGSGDRVARCSPSTTSTSSPSSTRTAR